MHYSKEEKTKWLDNWRQSGKSAWAYAKENGLSPQTFLKWTKTGLGKKSELVEIPKSIMAVSRLEPEIVIEKGDVKIHIPFEPVRCEVRDVMELLRQTL